ncbi:MAG: glycosyltransferase family 9 protein [Acidobacteriaceae bacterium]|nr:glycosyltransferase family 9 protein [Acidobacteriaceae bacterium]MBV9443572.1 glycosyltransferase family 9 protein [Acidobacteriaceae bacterium]
MTVLEQLPQGSRVAIIRLRSLGDCVLTSPAISLLKQTRSDLEIGVAVEQRFTTVFEGNPSVSRMLEPTWQAIRAWKPKLCLNLHGGTRSQWMAALSGARWRAGFAHHSLAFVYNLRIPRAQRILGVNRTVHTAEHLASAMFALGVPLQPVPGASLFASDSPLQGRYAVLHPFASSPEKQWPAARFCELARYLRLWNIRPVFLAGPSDDPTAFAPHQVFRGSLRDVKALLSKACVFIGNDSGPAHMAAAFRVPSVVLFSSSNPAIWSPWCTEAEIVVAPDGLGQVTVSRVIAALERLRALEEAHA